jgi:hypothetical protein
MSVIYTTAVKSARMNAVVAQIGSTGVLEIGTTSMGSILATIPLAATAGTVIGLVLTLTQALQDTSADATGTAAEARIRTATAGTDIITGLTVGTSGSDINLNNVSITVGSVVSITSAAIIHS